LPGGSTIFGGGLPYVCPMVKNPSILSRMIHMLIRITSKILPPLSFAKSDLLYKFQPNPPENFCEIMLTKKQISKCLV